MARLDVGQQQPPGQRHAHAALALQVALPLQDLVRRVWEPEPWQLEDLLLREPGARDRIGIARLARRAGRAVERPLLRQVGAVLVERSLVCEPSSRLVQAVPEHEAVTDGVNASQLDAQRLRPDVFYGQRLASAPVG